MKYCGYHTHTTFSDGKNTVEEMVQAAIERGMPAIGISDHSDSPYQAYCMREAAYPAYVAEIDRIKDKYKDRIAVMAGMELDYFSRDIIRNKLDYVIGSVHELVFEDRFYGIDHALSLQQACVERDCGGDLHEFERLYFETVVKNVKKNRPDIVGHFDVIVKFGLIDEEDPVYRKYATDALEQIIPITPVVEVNTGAISRGYRDRPYPSDYLLGCIRELGGEVILGADTHNKDTIDCAFPQAVEIVRKAGFDHLLTLWPDGFHREKIRQI